MLELTVDNDVLIKLSRYNILAEIRHISCEDGCEGEVGVLTAARFVCASRLERAIDRGEAEASSIVTLMSFLASADSLEPTPEELALAARLEDTAQTENIQLDSGESILAAVSAVRRVNMLTGDKRAVVAMESLLKSFPELMEVAGRVICLEQVLVSLSDSLGALNVRVRICADPMADTAIRLVFSCGSEVRDDFYPTGLISYIDDLRRNAPTMLSAGNDVRLAS